MYFPYLRGKQFELIALREFSTQLPNSERIIPIIEPVKADFNSLTTAVNMMFENRQKFALILNPNDGDFRRTQKNVLSEVSTLTANIENWIPAFLHQNNTPEIRDAIQANSLSNVMIVFKDHIEVNNAGIMELLSDPEIEYIVNGNPASRLEMRKLGMLEKKIIRLDNCFIEQQRNADYSNIPEDKFTEEHRFFTTDHFFGISDYTALPKDFIDGGMLPYAIAIHLTYEKNQDEIYVRHFVSDTNDDRSNIQGKFFEATIKVKNFFSDIPRTNAINELIRFLDEDRYPGLGTIKKLSIKNHIELMNRILSV